MVNRNEGFIFTPWLRKQMKHLSPKHMFVVNSAAFGATLKIIVTLEVSNFMSEVHSSRWMRAADGTVEGDMTHLMPPSETPLLHKEPWMQYPALTPCHDPAH